MNRTFGEQLSAVVNAALTEQVPVSQVIFTLDMLSHELKTRLLARAVQPERTPPPLIVTPGN